jgi:adenylate cyclase
MVAALRRVRQALPGDAGFGDPLSSAGPGSASAVARVADRLFDEQPRASKELGLGALQVWQSFLERTGRGQGDRELTLVFTDLVGFSSWAVRAGDDDALALLRAVASAVEPCLLAHRGRIVKRLGDGVMATFPSAQLAFDAVVDAREQLAAVDIAGHRPQMRAGLHTGSPRLLGGDYLGVDVNIAARLVEKASANEILVSDRALAGLDTARVSTRRKKTFLFTRVKGMPDDVAVYAAEPA